MSWRDLTTPEPHSPDDTGMQYIYIGIVVVVVITIITTLIIAICVVIRRSILTKVSIHLYINIESIHRNQWTDNCGQQYCQLENFESDFCIIKEEHFSKTKN